jgi:RNA polymerase sigma factor (sigma-70 family)
VHRNPEPSFQALFHEHYAAIVRRLLPLVGDQTVAEDLTQDAFLKLYRNPPDDLTRVAAWLHRVAVNLAYDHLRRVAVRSRQDRKDREQAAAVGEGAYPSNEEIALGNWERDNVRRALNKLSERDRTALMLREQGYSYAEIADRLGIGASNVGSLLLRAGERLKKHYFTEEGQTHERSVQG